MGILALLLSFPVMHAWAGQKVPVPVPGFTTTQQQQQVTIKGKVTDKSGTPLPGVSIVVQGTTNGVSTDYNGNYSIRVQPGQTLIFSFVGYKKQYIVVNKQKVLNVVMQESTSSLNEVVVVGYGTQKKVNLTGSVSAIKGTTLAKKTMPNVTESLQGEVPGLTIIDHGGAPGVKDLRMYIRGISSLSAGTYPLVLVDGIQMPISDVNPYDIKNISVLKDAASAAIYGAQAANGVILITTKRGETGKLHVNYEGYYGIQTPASLPHLVDAKDYLEMVNEALVNAGQQPKYSQDYIEKTVSGTDPIHYPYTNYPKELYNQAPTTNQHLSISGGNKFIKTAFFMNYNYQDGMLENVGANSTSLRMNNDFTFSKKFKVKSDIWYSLKNSHRPNRYEDALSDMIGTSPATVMKYPNGVYGLNKDNTSALADLEVSGKNQNKDELLNIQLGAEWNIFKGFVLKGNFSYKTLDNKFKNFRASYDFVDPNDTTKVIAKWTPSSLTQGDWSTKEINGRVLADYTLNTKNSHFHALGGIDITDSHSAYLEGYRKDLYSNDFPELNMGSVDGETNKGYTESWGLWSYLGRINYNFKERYLVEANFRYDGSSRFAEGHRWGFFPSFSAGWIISNENFLKDVNWLSNLKLRGSWGQLGNQNIGLYRYASTVYSGINYNFNDKEVQGYSQLYYANKDITWETSQMADFGLDAGFFADKLQLTFDWYNKKTKDVLLVLPISQMVGLYPSETNAGVVTNRGWETSITYKDVVKDFHYSVSFNIAYLHNELTDFAGHAPSISGWSILEEGQPLYAIYGYKADGLFQSQEEIDNHAKQPNQQDLKPGDIKLVDLNGDGVIDDKDRTVLGSTIPKYTYGGTLTLGWKGLDLLAVFQGTFKVQNYFYGALNEGPNFEIFTTTRCLDHWTPENRDASFPRLEAATNKNNYLYNSFWVRDASYLRLKTLQIGYSLPQKTLRKTKLTKTRFYISGTNVFTITSVDPGIDPETYSGRFRAYPPVRTILFGVQIGL
jgi:TonB-linked SusC/RagA family outer membrane protein